MSWFEWLLIVWSVIWSFYILGTLSNIYRTQREILTELKKKSPMNFG